MPRYRTVIFDCDSTLSTIEGIDELAAARRDEVARLTEAAMRGEIPLEHVYGRRLALVQPTRAAVEALATRYVECLVPDARATVDALHGAGVDVRIVSGGLLPAVLAVAHALGIPDDRVAAVRIDFHPDGSYAGFDTSSPLATSDGKRTAIDRWHVARPAMMVGDGTTDLEARPVVDFFVAFAGVVERSAVLDAADAVVRARSLAAVLPLILAPGELGSAAHTAVYARGLALRAPTHSDPSRLE